MINIPTNPICNAVEDEAAQLVKKCINWVSNTDTEEIQVMWHIY